MTCTEFHDRYTEFRDGLITAPREQRRFQRHLARCSACGGHDAALCRGVRARAGIAAALFVAAALALVAVESLGPSRRASVAALPPVPFPKPVARAGVPFVTFQDPRASVVTGNPNPYGTALVQPASARPEPATVGR